MRAIGSEVSQEKGCRDDAKAAARRVFIIGMSNSVKHAGHTHGSFSSVSTAIIPPVR